TRLPSRCALLAASCAFMLGGARAFAAPLAVVAPQGATEWPVAPFVVELEGPLEYARFEGDTSAPGAQGMPAFVVELVASLAPGERLRLVAPPRLADPRGVALVGARAPQLVRTEPAGAEARIQIIAPPAPREASDPRARAARLVPPADDAPRRAP